MAFLIFRELFLKQLSAVYGKTTGSAPYINHTNLKRSLKNPHDLATDYADFSHFKKIKTSKFSSQLLL